ncbi:MAG: hypothetical protein AABX51_04345 [Nanoarchaeota archaeon]
MDEDTIFKIISVLVFIGIIGGMVTAAYILRKGPPAKNPNAITYNNFPFIRDQNNFWLTQWQNKDKIYNLQFRYLPNETLDIPVEGQIDNSFFTGEVYITFDPAPSGLQNLTLAAGELSLNLARGLNYSLKPSCTKNASGCENLPIITCEQNKSVPIIYLSYKTPTMISLNGNCITIQGGGRELIRSVDRLLYLWYGIITA